MTGRRHLLLFLVHAMAALVVYEELQSPMRSRDLATIPAVPVVVAAQDIPGNVVLHPGSIRVALWPAGTEPAGSYSSLDSVQGHMSRVAIYKGEPIVPGRLGPEGTGAGLEVKITPGKRAYAIRISDAASIAGMIQPNARVDIMVVMDDPDHAGKRVAKLFMTNMRVLTIGPMVGRTADGRPTNAAVATIEVTPEEPEKLAIAAAQGQLHLVLRGYGEPNDGSDPSVIRCVARTVIARASIDVPTRRPQCAAGLVTAAP